MTTSTTPSSTTMLAPTAPVMTSPAPRSARSSATSARPASSSDAPPRLSALRRILAIARAETLLLVRNRTVLLNALLLGPVMAMFLTPAMAKVMGDQNFTIMLVQMLCLFGLMFVIYYNLTSIVVARRESDIFQRMKTGQASEWEALVAAVLPSAVVVSVQILLGIITVGILNGTQPVLNPVALIIALLGGIIIFAGLGVWTSSWSSTVEAAQYSTMPVMMAVLFFSGNFLPIQYMPETLQTICTYTPLYAVNTLVGISMGMAPVLDGAGTLSLSESFTAIAQPSLVIALWIIIALVLASRTRFARRA